MASATATGRSPSDRSQSAKSAASTAYRSAADSGSAASAIEVGQSQGTIGLFDKLANAGFRRTQCTGRGAKPLHPFFEEPECFIEIQIPPVQRRDDLLESLNVLLVCHGSLGWCSCRLVRRGQLGRSCGPRRHTAIAQDECEGQA